MAWVLSQSDNEGQDKHVESVWFPCLDEGSIPSSSTNKYKRLMDWMNIGATILLVIIGIAIYIHKRKGEE